jgi:hypothetical protein
VTGLEDGEQPEAFAARCRELADAGIGHALVTTDGPWTDDALARLTEAVAGLGAT